MRLFINLTIVAAYFLMPNLSLALPTCQGSPAVGTLSNAKRSNWHNCVGDFEHRAFYINGKVRSSRYVGVFKNGKLNGYGFYTFWNHSLNSGFTWEGEFENDRNIKIVKNYPGRTVSQIKFTKQYLANKNSVASQKTQVQSRSQLELAFISETRQNRLSIQKQLKNLGLYKFNIDGLYGRGTKAALEEYNKTYLASVSLNDPSNVKLLLKHVLNNSPTLSKPSKKIEKPSIVEIKPVAPATVTTTKPPAETPKEDKFDKIIADFQISTYGSFLHTELVPNALFFFDKIEKSDSFEFRKAMRNHQIETIVLSSPGGSVFEGLQMAGIINDRQLNTYIPENGFKGPIGTCASACSFMYFAGKSRQSHGRLGVHQVYTPDGSEKEEVAKTEKIAQFTVSEIIGFLNEFETPPWVFEKMFQQSKMYFFDQKELSALERTTDDAKREQNLVIENFITNLKEAFD